MEFKDRVANKPNRVKLTYEDSGASSYATVELADEPIEEGTPLNKETFDGLQNEFNEQIGELSNELSNLSNDVDFLMQKLDKATLLFDYSRNNNKTLYAGDTATLLTNKRFLMYYITVYNSSTAITAGGVLWGDGAQYGWAIRGSGGVTHNAYIEELFVNLTHVGDKITLNGIISRKQSLLDGKYSYTEGQGIARIWGIGEV